MKRIFLSIIGVTVILLYTSCGGFFPKEEYHVYYYGNGNTAGYPPVDPKIYFSGDTATVRAPPSELKDGTFTFQGWRWPNSPLHIFQAGDTIRIDESDIRLYALFDGIYAPFVYHEEPVGEIFITNYNRTISVDTLSIPNFLEGKPVTALGNRAAVSSYLWAVDFPASLKYIGEESFASNYISHLTLPSSVVSIGTGAFQSNSIEELVLGTGLTGIAPYAFANNRLTLVDIPATIINIDAGAFSNNTITTIRIGVNVTIGSANAFGNHGGTFRTYYENGGKVSGLYLYYGGTWSGPFTE